MAKKVVASFQKTTDKKFTKVIQMKKSTKTGAYQFKETIVSNELVQNFLDSDSDKQE